MQMHDKVALVTGASRGGGRGIARVLGQAGLTVYVTGRSRRDSPGEVSGSIEDTADEVTQAGGKGIAVACDHRDRAQVAALFAQIERLDLLVNNAWGGYEALADLKAFTAPFWEQADGVWEAMFDVGVKGCLEACRHAVPLMLHGGRGLIVNIGWWDDESYLGNLYYDLAKNAVNRMTRTMAHELKEHPLTVVSLSPGFMRTERVLAAFAKAGKEPPDNLESVEYTGRAVRALLADPEVKGRSGQCLAVGQLAVDYGFTDLDGRRPPAYPLPQERRLIPARNPEKVLAP